MRDWDDAFDNMGHAPGSAALPQFWAGRAREWRAAHASFVDEALSYGPGPRHTFDLVRPDGEAAGLVVFVHGGFWMRLDRSYWSDLAEGARARGFAVALPSYTLTPAARIGEITREIAAAVEAAASRVAGPIRLIGHSTGGHLVTRMIVRDGPLPEATTRRIAGVVSLSGLHDLRPLRRTRMNETLRLTEDEALAESPALLTPLAGARVVAWVGGAERPEFLRQSRLLVDLWGGLDAKTQLVIDPGHNHFTILEALKSAHSPLVGALLCDT